MIAGVSDRIGISVIISGLSRLYGDDLAALVETARIAEDAGVDQIVLTDHLGIGPRTDRYPYGRFPFPNDEPWPEPLTTLAVLAGATQRIRLGTGILIAPLRPPLLLAKIAATLDVLSNGRLDLGIGSGWQREEFEAAGVPFAGRGARMDDAVRACRVLWRDAPASFASETVRFDGLWCLPRPIQKDGIPIWVGGALGPRNLARVVEYSAGWMPVAPSLVELREGGARLRAALAAAGRDPDSVGIRGAVAPVRGSAGGVDLERSLEALEDLREAGASVAAFALAAFARSRDEIRPFLERLGRI